MDDILRDLFSPLTPSQTAYMVQIILRDLTPLLYPLPTSEGGRSLLKYNSAAYEELTVVDAMAAFDERLPRLYRLYSDIDTVTGIYEQPNWEAQAYRPRIGTPVTVRSARSRIERTGLTVRNRYRKVCGPVYAPSPHDTCVVKLQRRQSTTENAFRCTSTWASIGRSRYRSFPSLVVILRRLVDCSYRWSKLNFDA
jgi:hypothetical protein